MRTVNAPVPLLVAPWLLIGASVALAAPPPAPPGPSARPEAAPARAREEPHQPSPASARVQVDKICPVAQDDAKRVLRMQAAERRTELLRVLAQSVTEAQKIASRRWDERWNRWIAQVYKRARERAARHEVALSPDLLPRALCRAVALRAPARCRGLPQGDRLMCELLAHAFQAQGGAEACPRSGLMGSACRFLKTYDLDAVRGTQLEARAVSFLKNVPSLGALCDHARTHAEAAADGAPTCIATAVFTGVHDGLKACPEERPGDSPGFRAVIAQCRAMVGGEGAECDDIPDKARAGARPPVKFLVEARVFPTLSGPIVSVFLVAPTPQACALELEADAWDGTARRFRVAGTTAPIPGDGNFLAPAPVPTDVRPGQDARLVSKTCVPWAAW